MMSDSIDSSRDTARLHGRDNPQRNVWDRFVRLFHWALLGAVAVALVTGLVLDASWVRMHLIAGVGATALVVSRIVWGFTGPTYARFSQFVPSPGRVMAHLKGAETGRHIGHNPLGALMVLALLGTVLALAVSGVIVLGGALKTGPLGFAIPTGAGELFSELHEIIAFGLIALIVLHLLGVAIESRRSRENLSRAMMTGRKPMRFGDLTAPARRARPILALGIVAVLAGGAAGLTAQGARIPPANSPVAELLPAHEEECTACHMAYHPSLRPGKSWTLMMAGLDDHFGEDASLDSETTAEITAWLVANAAETVDSRPANLWRDLVEETPVALPDTEVWKQLHEELDPAIFKRRAVYSSANCAACHRDAATGWFSPFSLSIPKDKTP